MNDNGSHQSERRKFPRKPCLISVECGIQDSVFSSQIRNISYNGVYIETQEPFDVGQVITLRVLAPYKLKNVKQLSGKIVRTEPNGIAVSFIKEDDEQEAMIKAFVENI